MNCSPASRTAQTRYLFTDKMTFARTNNNDETKGNNMRVSWMVYLLFCGLISVFSVDSHAVQFSESVTYTPLDELENPLTQFSSQTLHPIDPIPLDKPRYSLTFTFESKKQPDTLQGVFIGMLGAYKAYWDGKLIGQNGVAAYQGYAEQAGKIDSIFYLPLEAMSAGEHTLHIVASSMNAKGQTEATAWAFVGDYGFLSTIGLKRAIVPLVMSGAMLLLFFYMIAAYFSAGREAVSQLFCGCFCLVLFLMMLTESWRGLVGYTYDWHGTRLQIVTLLTFVSALSLSLFSCFLFHINRHVRVKLISVLLASLPIILLSVDSYDMRSLLMLLAGAVVSLAAVGVAISAKQQYAKLMLVSLLIFLSPLALGPMDFMDRYFYVSSAALIAFMLFIQTRILRNKHEQLAQSQQAQIRLELELLKKNLQPHFLLNTLTAIEEWIEESPAMAVSFIQALADEFRTMSKLSSRPLIRLEEEVAWCENYLRVLGFRNGLTFELDAPLVLPTTQLPPGILLTLVENAISHSVYQQGQFKFSLEQRIDTSRNYLRFSSPVTQQATKALKTGLGNQYILARLTEAFPDEWQFSAELEGKLWVAELSFPVSFAEEQTL